MARARSQIEAAVLIVCVADQGTPTALVLIGFGEILLGAAGEKQIVSLARPSRFPAACGHLMVFEVYLLHYVIIIDWGLFYGGVGHLRWHVDDLSLVEELAEQGA